MSFLAVCAQYFCQILRWNGGTWNNEQLRHLHTTLGTSYTRFKKKWNPSAGTRRWFPQGSCSFLPLPSRSLKVGDLCWVSWLTNRTNIKYLHRYLAVCVRTSKSHLVLCLNSSRMDFLSLVCVGCDGTLLSRYTSSILMHILQWKWKAASKISRNDILVVPWIPEKFESVTFFTAQKCMIMNSWVINLYFS